MKILFNTMNLGKGGAERVINILANEFVKKYKVKIITHLNMPIEYEFNDNIEIVSIEKKHRSNLLFKLLSRISILKLYRLKKEVLLFKPDIIISFLPEPSFRILTLKKFSKKIRNIPVIVSVRNDPNVEYNNFVYKAIMKSLYPQAEQLILQTTDSQKYFEKNINKKGKVIYNPVSDVFLNERKKKYSDNSFVAIGRLEDQKDYKTMIDAFDLFLKKGYSDYILNIYGDGTQKDILNDYIEEKKLNSFIFLKGKTNDVKSVLDNSKIFIMSSKYEGMPNSLLEAMCYGVTCISTDCPCGGPKEILDSGNNGILVPVGDSVSLSNAMEQIITEKKLVEEFNNNSKKFAKKFDKENIVSQWEKVIKEFMKEG